MALNLCQRSAIAAIVVAVGAAVSVAPAQADGRDDRYIEYLDWKGVPYQNRTEVIRVGKEYCLLRTRQAANKSRVTRKVANEMGWSDTEANFFINAAIEVYCPHAW